MQSPASSIQSPRPQGRASSQVPFDKELMASLHVLLNQLGEVERQGLVMFHKIEESFKHSFTQQEAITDTANLLVQLDALINQAKTTGFGALTILPTSPTVASTPSASASASVVAGTPKPTFLSPRMHNHIHNNLHTNTNITTGNNITDTQMFSPPPLSVVSTPAASGPGSTPLVAASASSAVAADAGSVVPTPTTTPALTNTVTATGAAVPSPFPSSDIIMSSSTPAASGSSDPSSVINIGTPATMGVPATPATPSANSNVNPGVALSQMMDARQRDVHALYTEKRKLGTNFKVAAQMIRT
ncbi:hypothetical protein BGZ51_001110 [Haplosporangium sp. Z 767]|nr:hypothetical protein BGZ50_001908 [Haplosporangium sp. Z 11]KAF9187725.1 hypothetical protein BGZ51_001110 [Haplosporangium sp. Z 767]